MYLFHLHHAHLQLSSSSLLQEDGGNNAHEAGPGGSARRHKMDLANFLLQRQKKQHEQDKAEAQEEGGWKGGSEENFIKLVNEISQNDPFTGQTGLKIDQNDR